MKLINIIGITELHLLSNEMGASGGVMDCKLD